MPGQVETAIRARVAAGTRLPTPTGRATGLLDRHYWATRHQLATAVFDYIETFYNRRGRHSALDYHSPTDYETIPRWHLPPNDPLSMQSGQPH